MPPWFPGDGLQMFRSQPLTRSSASVVSPKTGGGGGRSGGFPLWIFLIPILFFGAGIVGCIWIVTHQQLGPEGTESAPVASPASVSSAPAVNGGASLTRSALEVAIAAAEAAASVTDTKKRRKRSKLLRSTDSKSSSDPSSPPQVKSAAGGGVSSSRELRISTSSVGFTTPLIRHALSTLSVDLNTAADPYSSANSGSYLLPSDVRGLGVPLLWGGLPRYKHLFSRDLLLSGLILTETTAAAKQNRLRATRAPPPKPARTLAVSSDGSGDRSGSEASRLGTRLLRSALLLGAATQGRSTALNKITGEESGKIIHQIPYTVINERHTSYSACDTTALWLIALTRYWLITHDTPFVLQLEQNVQRALSYIANHVSPTDRYLFMEKDRFALKVTYWKDSILADRMKSNAGAPDLPVSYTVVHAAYIKAIRSALALPIPYVQTPAVRTEWINRLNHMRSALHQHLFAWNAPKPNAKGKSKSRTGYFRIGTDASGPLRGITSDTVHALWYLEHVSTGGVKAPLVLTDPTAVAPTDDVGPDLSEEQLAAIEQSAKLLLTDIGYRSRFVFRPKPPRDSSTGSAAPGAAADSESSSLNGHRKRIKARAEDDNGEDSSDAGSSSSKNRESPTEYHGNAVWPFEQALIHQAAKRFGLKSIVAGSQKMRHAMHVRSSFSQIRILVLTCVCICDLISTDSASSYHSVGENENRHCQSNQNRTTQTVLFPGIFPS